VNATFTRRTLMVTERADLQQLQPDGAAGRDREPSARR
jgi:hypothetical protein